MDFPWIILSKLVDPRSRIMVAGVMDISTSSNNQKNEDTWDIWKVKIKSYQFPVNGFSNKCWLYQLAFTSKWLSPVPRKWLYQFPVNGFYQFPVNGF